MEFVGLAVALAFIFGLKSVVQRYQRGEALPFHGPRLADISVNEDFLLWMNIAQRGGLETLGTKEAWGTSISTKGWSQGRIDNAAVRFQVEVVSKADQNALVLTHWVYLKSALDVVVNITAGGSTEISWGDEDQAPDRSAWPELMTGDKKFDRRFKVSSEDPTNALAYLSIGVRRRAAKLARTPAISQVWITETFVCVQMSDELPRVSISSSEAEMRRILERIHQPLFELAAELETTRHD